MGSYGSNSCSLNDLWLTGDKFPDETHRRKIVVLFLVKMSLIENGVDFAVAVMLLSIFCIFFFSLQKNFWFFSRKWFSIIHIQLSQNTQMLAKRTNSKCDRFVCLPKLKCKSKSERSIVYTWKECQRSRTAYSNIQRAESERMKLADNLSKKPIRTGPCTVIIITLLITSIFNASVYRRREALRVVHALRQLSVALFSLFYY